MREMGSRERVAGGAKMEGMTQKNQRVICEVEETARIEPVLSDLGEIVDSYVGLMIKTVAGAVEDEWIGHCLRATTNCCRTRGGGQVTERNFELFRRRGNTV